MVVFKIPGPNNMSMGILKELQQKKYPAVRNYPLLGKIPEEKFVERIRLFGRRTNLTHCPVIYRFET